MNIEIVDFYPVSKKKSRKHIGTLHAYIWVNGPDNKPLLAFDIRGIEVHRSKAGGYFFNLPKRKSYDPQEKKSVTYDILSFQDPSHKQQLIDFLHKEGKALIADKLDLSDHKKGK